MTTTARVRGMATGLFVLLMVVYNANGREMGTTDSQPLKFLAREIAVQRTLTLDRVVAERPGLGDRAAFQRDRGGHFRSAYPIVPALIAAVPATVLQVTGVVDMDAPLASNFVAKMTASALTAWAVALIFATLTRLVPLRPAVFATAAIGLGTNYWVIASQTLWRHETVAFGTALALWAWLRDPSAIERRHVWFGGIGLALAAASRPQALVLVAVLLVWLGARAGLKRAIAPAAIVAGMLLAVSAINIAWFGGPLGALPALEAVHPTVHGVPGPVSHEPWIGAAGLLISPSRGLFVFSPVLIVAVAAALGWTAVRSAGLGLVAVAVALQFGAYAIYSVWWGGHTYGPRYLIDVLAPLAPFLAIGADRLLRHRATAALALVLCAASIGIAAVGAFVHPNEQWNTRPAGVDLNHDRLWDWHDSQIRRTFDSDPSPQNFNLFSRRAFRPDGQ
jgi:hypothetical protein